jgi:hypothetical protein
VTVTAKDSNNIVATNYRGTIHFTSSDSTATLPADYTFTAADAGVHTFRYTGSPRLVLRTSGSQWVRTTDTVATGITGAQSGIIVTPGAARSLVISGIPSPYGAGVAHSLTVTAKDAYGNVATGYLGAIKFTSSDGAATLPATVASPYTFTVADHGVHKFSLGVTLRTAGTQWVKATDTVTSTITGTQSGIVVTPGAAKTLVVSGIPSPYVGGVAHSVIVTARDAYGNVATGYRGTINFTSSDTKAVLPGDYTFTALDAGVHKFPLGLTLKTAGTQWVRARDTVTSTITGLQNGIVVS